MKNAAFCLIIMGSLTACGLESFPTQNDSGAKALGSTDPFTNSDTAIYLLAPQIAELSPATLSSGVTFLASLTLDTTLDFESSAGIWMHIRFSPVDVVAPGATANFESIILQLGEQTWSAKPGTCNYVITSVKTLLADDPDDKASLTVAHGTCSQPLSPLDPEKSSPLTIQDLWIQLSVALL